MNFVNITQLNTKADKVHTHSYNNLEDLPTLFSGNYNDLLNKPKIPTAVSDLTNDLNLKHIAKIFLPNVDSIKDDEDDYTGYKHLHLLNNEEIAEIYSHNPQNKYNLLTNEYAIVHNSDGEIVDKVCWNGTEYRPIKFGNFESKWFNVKPYKNDIEQALLFDSLINNKITMVRGRAGSGKTLISLGYLL